MRDFIVSFACAHLLGIWIFSESIAQTAFNFVLSDSEKVVIPNGNTWGLIHTPDEAISYRYVDNEIRMWIASSTWTTLLLGSSFDNLVPFPLDVNGKSVRILAPSNAGFDSSYAGACSVLPAYNGTDLLMFYHAENHPCNGPFPFLGGIGLARSSDGGISWKRRGQIITSAAPKPSNCTFEAWGVGNPMVYRSRDGRFLYMLFTEWLRGNPVSRADIIYLARAPIESDGEPGSWQKFANGQFSQPGFGGLGTPAIDQPGGAASVYASLAAVSFNVLLNRFIVVFQSRLGFHVATSEDGITWDTPRLIWSQPDFYLSNINNVPGVTYPSLISPDQPSQMTTSQTGYLYFARGYPNGNPPHIMSRRRFEIKLIANLPAGSLDSLTASVNSIWCNGSIGTLLPTSSGTVAIASADERSATIPSTSVLASTFGSGRVVAYSHDGFLTDSNISTFDGLTLAVNAVRWLDLRLKKSVAISIGHGEFTNCANTSVLRNRLQQLGFTVSTLTGSLSSQDLTNFGAVMIGNAWGSISQAELDSLSSYMGKGGGLLLLGLGWSYLGNNPGKTLDDYPMNKIGSFCGLRWTGGTIADPSHTVSGAPLFTVFYPNIRTQSYTRAVTFLDSTTSVKNAALPASLQQDATFRADYVNALQYLTNLTVALPDTSSIRWSVYSSLTSLVNSYSTLFRRGFSYDMASQGTMIWIRERAHRTLRDAVPINFATKSQIASTLGLAGTYLDIWNNFSVLLLDNFELSSAQKDVIFRTLNLAPSALYASLGSISVKDFLGTPLSEVNLAMTNGEKINLFGNEVGMASENQFPSDIAPKVVDFFSIVLAHELNHIVEAFTIRNKPTLKARHDALILAAGTDSMNYCRSQLSRGFFVANPQEFFASMSNEWFADSKQMLRLAIQRFRSGKLHPINQFLFFADAYSQGSDTTLFYSLDNQGMLMRSTIRLHRTGNKFVDAITLFDSTYFFTLGPNGDVTGIIASKTTTVEPSIKESTPRVFQLQQNFPNPFNPSTTIRFSLPQSSFVTLRIYNMLGQLVTTLVDAIRTSGHHQVDWSPKLPSGVYFYRIEAGSFVESKKLVLLK